LSFNQEEEEDPLPPISPAEAAAAAAIVITNKLSNPHIPTPLKLWVNKKKKKENLVLKISETGTANLKKTVGTE
jgi:hypothetical protein